MSEAALRGIGNRANLLTSKQGLQELFQSASNAELKDLLNILTGKDARVNRKIVRGIGETFGPKAMRFAAKNPLAKNVLRVVPGLGTGLLALEAADAVAGDQGIGGKVADTLGMITGAGAGFVFGGPVGAATGAMAGKSLVDSAQGLMGGGKSEEERKIEELLTLMGR